MQDVASVQCRITGHFGIPFTARPAVNWKSLSGRSIGKIQDAVCAYYNIRKIDLVSERRTVSLIIPRQIAMYLARTLTPASLPKIGRAFGDRDHSTVYHAVNKIAAARLDRPKIEKQVSDLIKILEGGR